jgi:hypothetical protein
MNSSKATTAPFAREASTSSSLALLNSGALGTWTGGASMTVRVRTYCGAVEANVRAIALL